MATRAILENMDWSWRHFIPRLVTVRFIPPRATMMSLRFIFCKKRQRNSLPKYILRILHTLSPETIIRYQLHNCVIRIILTRSQCDIRLFGFARRSANAKEKTTYVRHTRFFLWISIVHLPAKNHVYRTYVVYPLNFHHQPGLKSTWETHVVFALNYARSTPFNQKTYVGHTWFSGPTVAFLRFRAKECNENHVSRADSRGIRWKTIVQNHSRDF